MRLTIFILQLLLAAAPTHATDVIERVWIRSRLSAAAAVMPEVQDVRVTPGFVEVKSSGISLTYFGPLQSPPVPVDRRRQFLFRIPRNPQPETGRPMPVRPDILGVFINGAPLYNVLETDSFEGRNLWHFDSISRNQGGHGFDPGVLQTLIDNGNQHSPLVGYALDGYPIYGPWGYSDSRVAGAVRQLRSSYQPRVSRDRTAFANGMKLTSTQRGPEVSQEFPAGTFTEDYAFVEASGDLDAHNGRFSVTPEYPEGTYAYFISTDGAGRLAFPYAIGPTYFGKISVTDLNNNARDLADQAESQGPETWSVLSRSASISLKTSSATIQAGQPVALAFTMDDGGGNTIRSLESVHERPVHLVVVSEDLFEFDHIHPALAAGNQYVVSHTFEHGGNYRLFVDVTPPGREQQIVPFEVRVEGEKREPRAIGAATITAGMTGPEVITAGTDSMLMFALADQSTEPYLGAWAHVMIVNEAGNVFIHAHPMDMSGTSAQGHSHAALADTPPDMVHVTASFPAPGLYKVWVQTERNGEVITRSYLVSAK